VPSLNPYLLSFLPGLDVLAQKPPMSPAEFLDRLDSPTLRRGAEAIFLADDLLQRDAVLAGDPAEPEPAVLNELQLTGEMPLPEEITARQEESPGSVEADALWVAYFRYAAALAETLHSPFLREWVRFEVGLRNALAEARADALGLESARYMVAEDLGDGPAGFAPTVAEWAQARNPMDAQRVLDRARWAWLDANDQYFTFANAELLAYAARLLLCRRWFRLEQAAENPSPTAAPTAAPST
jgi:hypothetical protein